MNQPRGQIAHRNTPDLPPLPLEPWAATKDTLHLWCQIVGKVRLASSPWRNHWWHAALHVTPRGLTTGRLRSGDVSFDIELDLLVHRLVVRAAGGGREEMALRDGLSVAAFHEGLLARLGRLGIEPAIRSEPFGVPTTTPFAEDTEHASYDAEAVERFHRVLLSAHAVFSHFRTGFLGKASPVHFFWGSFDLAVTRFSGRSAPRHGGGVPNLPDDVAQEAYSHEVSSAGFWPGGGAIDYPAYYSYAYPAPEGFSEAPVRPGAAFFSKELGEFVLSYDAVRTAADPRAALMDFLQSTYDAAADLGRWDRKALDCAIGEARVVRQF
jgi:Family of unknown function (DUF5996)